MRSVNLRQVAVATGGTLQGPARLSVASIGTDTRTPVGKDLFVALKGDRFDGHLFLQEAATRGAKAALVTRRNPRLQEFLASNPDFPLVLVGDTLKAIGDLAAYLRDRLDIMVAGITGTTGKTCTKDYLVSILSEEYKVASSPGSYNNEVGIPLTVFGVNKKDQVLITEMGARHPGDIKRLVDIVKPRFGIITNVGPGHLELFKTEDAVAGAKAELARAIPEEGTLVLNADDRWSRWMARQTSAPVVRFGFGRGSDYRATQVTIDGMGRPEFQLLGTGFEARVRLPGAGRHQVANALAAAACAHAMGVPAERIARGLETASLSRWRMEVNEIGTGYLVINDAYNSNPHSMAAALETLAAIGSGHRTVAVLGCMAELGKFSRQYHDEAGRKVAALDIDLLLTVGRRARVLAAAALEAGMPRGSVFRCDDIQEVESVLGDILEPGDVILIKASRVAGLESLAESLDEFGLGREKLMTNV